jgi:hypothetical protein
MIVSKLPSSPDSHDEGLFFVGESKDSLKVSSSLDSPAKIGAAVGTVVGTESFLRAEPPTVCSPSRLAKCALAMHRAAAPAPTLLKFIESHVTSATQILSEPFTVRVDSPWNMYAMGATNSYSPVAHSDRAEHAMSPLASTPVKYAVLLQRV